MKVTAPDGTPYCVTRRWLPWWRRVRDLPDAVDTTWWSFPDGDDPISAVIGLVLLVLLLPFVLFFLVGAAEVLLLLALLPLVLVARSLLGMPWTIEVRRGSHRFGSAPIRTEDVKGWAASQRRIEELAAQYSDGAPIRR